MALTETGLDFSSEDWDTAVPFFDGAWVIASRHLPGRNAGLEVNNRTFVFRVGTQQPSLVVFGWGDQSAVAAVQQLSKAEGLPVRWIVGNGGGHHLFLELWYQGFPDARVLVPEARIPTTRNGRRLQEVYADRWELLEHKAREEFEAAVGDSIELAIFNQLHQYSDDHYAKTHGKDYGKDHASPLQKLNGFTSVWRLITVIKDTSQRTDEVVLFHKPSGLVIGGHNYQFSYIPKDHKPEPQHVMATGPFPLNLMLKLLVKRATFVSTMEVNATPIGDPRLHAQTWEKVLAWPLQAWTTAHDPPRICGPDMSSDELKAAIRASLTKTGELDPSGAAYKGKIIGARG